MFDLKDSSSLLKEFEKHLKVDILDRGLTPGHKGSPFRSYHDSVRGVFSIHSDDASDYKILWHELGHLIAWVANGSPRTDQFGCGPGVVTLTAEDLEFDACCVEVVLHLEAGYSAEYVTRLMLREYEYASTLERADGVGYVGEDEFVADAIARGKDLLEGYLR